LWLKSSFSIILLEAYGKNIKLSFPLCDITLFESLYLSMQIKLLDWLLLFWFIFCSYFGKLNLVVWFFYSDLVWLYLFYTILLFLLSPSLSLYLGFLFFGIKFANPLLSILLILLLFYLVKLNLSEIEFRCSWKLSNFLYLI